MAATGDSLPGSRPASPAPSIEEPATVESCKERLDEFIAHERQGLRRYEIATEEFAQKALTMNEQLRNAPYNCPPEVAADLMIMTLYDLVLLIDDSTSMKTWDKGSRITALKRYLEIILGVYALAGDGKILGLRFLNSEKVYDKVTTAEVLDIVGNHKYNGLTRIGTALWKKIMLPFVFQQAKEAETLAISKKPMLVMIITDGKIEGERDTTLKNVLIDSVNRLKKRPNKGTHSVGFQFSRIGEDKGALDLLAYLDNHKVVGTCLDCQPAGVRLGYGDFGTETDNNRWVTIPKLLLGAVMPNWNDMDDNDTKDRPDDVVVDHEPDAAWEEEEDLSDDEIQ